MTLFDPTTLSSKIRDTQRKPAHLNCKFMECSANPNFVMTSNLMQAFMELGIGCGTKNVEKTAGS